MAYLELPTLTAMGGRFLALLERSGLPRLRRGAVTTLQVNVGKLCNQACHHCHVDAGPRRTEILKAETAARIIELLERSPTIDTVDITGGAPELNGSFETLARAARALQKRVIARCNLTVLFEPGMERLPEIYTRNQVEIIASLPCYLEDNVDKQRGSGVFEKSIAALRLLNGLGYGLPDSPLALHLVYNPLGAHLPPPQSALESAYKAQLRSRYGIEFHRLFTITNMPISRFADQLAREQKTEAYMGLLVNHFNPDTLPGLMCRSLVSVGWEGSLYDCDFNQMLELPIDAPPGPGGRARPSIWDIPDLGVLAGLPIRTADHCLGCTAGAGSSCGGALA
jgi:radical SAM/Cys-rich protein